MTIGINADQWNALRQAGHTDAAIAQHYHFEQAPAPAIPAAPPIPGGGAPSGATAPGYTDAQPCATPDLSRAAYGVVEGRTPEDGVHLVRIVHNEQKKTQQMYPMGATFIRFVLLESTNPENEIGGEYSKAYSHNPADGFGRPLDDLKGWITQVVEHKHPEWQPRRAWDNKFVDYCNGPDQGAQGLLFKLRTESRKGTRGRDFVKYDWGKGVVPEGTSVHTAAPAPTLSMPAMPAPAPAMAVPPMPAPAAPVVPPMPAPAAAPAVPPMPAPPNVPPSIPGGSAHGLGPKPPGWVGDWPPGGVP